MKRDPIVLGEGYILSGDDIGRTRPNGNALIVGTTGCGKSTSVVIPTIGRSRYSNPILSYAKESDGLAMARYLQKRGYEVGILNIMRPEKVRSVSIRFCPSNRMKTLTRWQQQSLTQQSRLLMMTTGR